MGTLLYIGNNKFYLKYKADEGAEMVMERLEALKDAKR